MNRAAPDDAPAAGLTDPVAWDRLRAGDPAALEALFERHCDAAYTFAFRRTTSWAAAEDAVQSAFVALWSRARAGTLPELAASSARPYLLVLTGNVCRNAERSRARRQALVVRLGALAEPANDPAELAVDRVTDERVMRMIRAEVDRLPRRQREVLELVAWGECSVADVAEVLGVPARTVTALLYRARHTLRGRVDTLDEITSEGTR